MELDIGVIGDVVLMNESLRLLRRRVRKANREKLIWFGKWPGVCVCVCVCVCVYVCFVLCVCLRLPW